LDAQMKIVATPRSLSGHPSRRSFDHTGYSGPQ
jgi:hypothetical protein